MSFLLLGAIGSQAAGGAANWETISSQTLSSSSTTVTFSNIPSSFKHLQLYVNGWNTGGGNLTLNFNGSGSGDTFRMSAVTSTFYNDRVTATEMYGGSIGSNTNKRLTSMITIPNYTNTNVNKSFIAQFGNGYQQGGLFYGNQYSTSAISSITLTGAGSYAAGSTFELIGIP